MQCKLTILSRSISLSSLTNVQVKLVVVTSVVNSSKTGTR